MVYKGVCIDKNKKEVKIQQVSFENVWEFMVDNMYNYYEVKLLDEGNKIVLRSVDGKPCHEHIKSIKKILSGSSDDKPIENTLDKVFEQIFNVCETRKNQSPLDLARDYVLGENLTKPKLEIIK